MNNTLNESIIINFKMNIFKNIIQKRILQLGIRVHNFYVTIASTIFIFHMEYLVF